MFEGQNIHLSPIDGKKLCSFSQKICKQHRLNGYAFCIRHILEDKNSPFRQCQFKTKANGEKCFNPVPEAADRVYCSSHLQVLGMLPKNHKQCPEKKKMVIKKKDKKDKKDPINSKNTSDTTDKDSAANQKKMNKKARKILEEDYVKVYKLKMNWYSVMTKVFKQTAYNLHTWQKQGLDIDTDNFLKSRKYRKQNREFFRVHVVDDCDDCDDDPCEDTESIDAFQSILLDNHERVHHNLLCVDPPIIQEQKMCLKLIHRNGQLKQAVASKLERSCISYSVLSKLIASARKSTAQTANILNLESGTSSYGSFRFHRERQKAVSYQIPCSLLSGDVCCTNMAMPYSKYCRDHISRDPDQFLFSVDLEANVGIEPNRTLDFLRGGELPSSNQSKRKGDTPPVTQSKRSYQRLKSTLDEKTLKKKKSKMKRKPNKRPVNSLRDEMQKKFDIPSQQIQKLSTHLKNVEEKSESLFVKQEVSSNSNTDEDDDNDILTPEEAFHLPPGSLSFSPRIVDDDSMPTIQNRNCTLDEDDEELIRCSSNFPFDANNQLPRDIGSPTLNQLSSSDFVSSFNNIFMSPAKTLDSIPTPHLNKTSFQQPFSTPICRPNNPPNINNRLSHSNQPVMINDQKSGSTVLKISPADIFIKPSSKMDHNHMYTHKQLTDERSIRNNAFNSIVSGVHDAKMMMQYRNNGLSSLTNQQMVDGNEHLSSYAQTHNGLGPRSHNIPIKETIGYDQTSLSKRYLSDSLLMQQPLSQDSTLFDDINTDVESPLEKVNPDIFFSSVFPVSTSTASI